MDYRTHDHTVCVFTQHDRRVRLVHDHLVHFLNPPCCRSASCGRDSHVTCAVAEMRRDYSFVNDVETIDVKRRLYGWIQLMLVCLLNSLSVSPCIIIEHRAWFALIESEMSVSNLIRLFDKSRPTKVLVLNVMYRVLARFLIKRLTSIMGRISLGIVDAGRRCWS
jgi:hypothetical protein